MDNYGAFLKRNAKELSATNKALQGEFRQRYGGTYRDEQDTYMTQVYNYFALPPAMTNFCDVSYAISGEVVQIEPANLEAYASAALPRIESVFEDFFRAYEQYRVDMRAWHAAYGPPMGTATVPGYTDALNAAPTVVPAQTAADPMAANPDVSQPGEPQDPIDVAPVTGQAPIVITEGNGSPSTANLPTEGPIFQSGEVVQGEPLVDEHMEADGKDDTPVP